MPESNIFSAFSPGEGTKTYTLLLSVTEEISGTCYVVYTDHSETEEGETRVFASIYTEDPSGPILLPIESDEMWNYLEALLENFSAP